MNVKCILIVVILFAASSIAAQDKAKDPQLIDQITRSNGEGRSARFDNYFIQLQNDPDSRGIIFVYCGKTCRYGEVESHIRGMELKIDKRLDRSRVTIMFGGYRDVQEVELWIQPEGACAPVANASVNIKNVTFTKATLKLVEPYDCCGSLDAEWKKFKPSKK